MSQNSTAIIRLAKVWFSVRAKILLVIFILLTISIGGLSKFATDQFIDDKSAYIYDSNFNHLETFSKNVKSIIRETSAKVITLAFINQTTPEVLPQLFSINTSLLQLSIVDASSESLTLKSSLTNEDIIRGEDYDNLKEYVDGISSPIEENIDIIQTNKILPTPSLGLKIKNSEYKEEYFIVIDAKDILQVIKNNKISNVIITNAKGNSYFNNNLTSLE